MATRTLFQHWLAILMLLALAGCGPGIGGTGTGEAIEPPAGLVLKPVCESGLADLLRCTGLPGTAASALGTSLSLLADDASRRNALLRLEGNAADLEVFCAGLQFSGNWGQLPGQAPWDARVEADHQPAGSAWTFTAAWRWRARVLSQGPSGRTLGESATHSGDLAALWQQNSANRWRFSVTGLGVPDTLETAVREWAGGTDSQQTTLQEAPRWRVQWMHRF